MFQVGKSTTDPTKLGPLGKDISKIYNDIAKDTRGAVKTVGNPEVRCNNFHVGKAKTVACVASVPVERTDEQSQVAQKIGDSKRSTGRRPLQFARGQNAEKSSLYVNACYAGYEKYDSLFQIFDLHTSFIFCLLGFCFARLRTVFALVFKGWERPVLA